MRTLVISLMWLAAACTGPVGSPAAGDVVAIVGPDEPGPSMLVSGRAVDANTAEPISGARVIVYQTDPSGTYSPEDPTDESTARIRGDLTADADGRFAFSTVQPGEYPGQPPGNRHIHFHEVTAEGYESRTFLLLFEDNVRNEVRSWAKQTGFGLITELEGDHVAGCEASVEIELTPTSP